MTEEYTPTPREPGVDYSEQSWCIAGLPPTKDFEEAQALIRQVENQTGGQE